MLIRVDIAETLENHGPFFVLIHTHDHIWNDHAWDAHTRVASCTFIQDLWIDLIMMTRVNQLKAFTN